MINLCDLELVIKHIYPNNLNIKMKKQCICIVSKKILEGDKIDKEWEQAWLKYIRKIRKSIYSQIILNFSLLDLMIKKNILDKDDVNSLLMISTEKKAVDISSIILNYKNNNFTEEESESLLEQEWVSKLNTVTYFKKFWSFSKKSDNTLILKKYKGSFSFIVVPNVIGKFVVTEIGKHVFFKKSEIDKIILPEGLKIIVEEAFANCYNLKTINIPESIEAIGDNFVQGCKIEQLILPNKINNLKCFDKIYSDFPYVKSLILPEGLTDIPSKAFKDYMNMESLYISSTIKTIGEDILENCNNIKSVIVSKDNETFYSKDNKIFKKSNNICLYCKDKKIITLDQSQINLTSCVIKAPKGTDGSMGCKGEYVYFGDWPQSIKKADVIIDKSTIYKVNNWDCYKGSDGFYYVNKTAKPFNSSYCYSNGDIVNEGESYYFKIEKIKWRVLSKNYQGGNLLLAEQALYSMPFSTSKYDCKYEKSDVRLYLNNIISNNTNNIKNKGFLNSAFSPEAILKINTVELSNDSCVTNIKDKVFLLSKNDITNPFFNFGEANNDINNNNKECMDLRVRITTDFAIATGAFSDIRTDRKQGCWWFLRTLYENRCICGVSSDGNALNYSKFERPECCIVPALSVRF